MDSSGNCGWMAPNPAKEAGEAEKAEFMECIDERRKQMKVTSPRGRILEEALGLTQGDRNKTYGSPKSNLECFVRLFDAYWDGRIATTSNPNLCLNATDGAIIMLLAKVSRVAVNQGHKDNYVDMAAYAAIAAECSDIGTDEEF